MPEDSSRTNEDPPATGARKLVLVVHGVGDPSRGWTVQELARQLCDDPTLKARDEEFPWGEGTVTTRVCRATMNEKRVLFAEVFWGDLSHVGHNFLGILRGFFDVLFRLRHVADQATAGFGGLGFLLGRLCYVAAWLLRGPIAALNLCLAGLAVLGGAMLLTGKDLDGNAQRALLVYGTTLVICFGMVAWSFRKLRPLTFCVAACGGLMVALSLAMPALADNAQFANLDQLASGFVMDHPFRMGSFAWYGQVLVIVLTIVWLLLVTVMLLALLIWWPARMLQRGGRRRGLDLAYVVTALGVGIWGLAIPALWLGVGQFAPLSAPVKGYFFRLFDAAVPFLGVQWLMAIVFGGAVFATLGKWRRWSNTFTPATYDPENPAPRLLVGPYLQWTLIATSAVGTLAAVGLTVANGLYAGQLISDELRGQIETVRSGCLTANRVLIPLTGLTVLALFVPWVQRQAQFGLDIAMDVVNHFRRQEETGAFMPRDQIRNRFHKILDAVVQHEDPNEVMVVAHSQGAIVAVNVLCRKAEMLLARCGGDREKLTLVTMGAPLTHLYQFYFPLMYPVIGSEHWDGLFDNVGRWINIYRINDFVGTHLDCRDTPGGPVPANFYVGPRGHTLYWNDVGSQPPDPDDPGVIAILKREVPL